MVKRVFQVFEAHVFINIKPFYLVKKAMRPRRNGLVAKHPPRHNGPKRGLKLLHEPNLNVGGVRAQQHIFVAVLGVFFHKKCVLHLAGGVIFWKV